MHWNLNWDLINMLILIMKKPYKKEMNCMLKHLKRQNLLKTKLGKRNKY